MWIFLVFFGIYWLLYDYLGTIALIYLNFKLFRNVLPWLNHYFNKTLVEKVDFKKFGEWAVVTGSTDGIGKAYAQELAERGLNVVLISRSPEKLENCAKEIEDEFRVKVKTIAVDFSHGFEIYETIKKGLENLQVGILVNNVGTANSLPDNFHKFSKDFHRRMINTNINSMIQMCHIVIPQMLERRSGAIINISSVQSEIPTPLTLVYTATKSFNRKFSQDLAFEYEKKGIQVQTVMPGPVSTKMIYIKKGTYGIALAPREFVRDALNKFGRGLETFGCFQHALMMALSRFVCAISIKLYSQGWFRYVNGARKLIMKKVNAGKFTLEKFHN